MIRSGPQPASDSSPYQRTRLRRTILPREPRADMKRRVFLGVLGGALAASPLTAGTQQAERVRRIGVLLVAATDDAEYQARVGAFQQALALLGWNIGRN